MKTQSNSSVTQVSKENTENSGVGFYQSKARIFTAADLWNIQRQGKSKTQRRYSF